MVPGFSNCSIALGCSKYSSDGKCVNLLVNWAPPLAGEWDQALKCEPQIAHSPLLRRVHCLIITDHQKAHKNGHILSAFAFTRNVVCVSKSRKMCSQNGQTILLAILWPLLTVVCSWSLFSFCLSLSHSVLNEFASPLLGHFLTHWLKLHHHWPL